MCKWFRTAYTKCYYARSWISPSFPVEYNQTQILDMSKVKLGYVAARGYVFEMQTLVELGPTAFINFLPPVPCGVQITTVSKVWKLFFMPIAFDEAN